MSLRFPAAAAALVALLALTGCTASSENARPATSGPDSSDAVSTGAEPTGELAFRDTTGSAESDSGVDDDDTGDEDLVVFIAAGERMLVNGPYEGVIYESPEVYVAVAQSFCRRLDDGVGVNRIVADFAVESGFDLTDYSDRTLIGSVLGAGVETLCPRHSDLL